MSGNTVLFELMDKEVLSTDNTTSYEMVMAEPVLEDLAVEDVTIHLMVHDTSGTPYLKTGLQYSYDGLHWEAQDIDTETSLTAPTYKIHTWSTRTTFGRKIRFEVGIESGSGTSKVTLSATAEVRLHS